MPCGITILVVIALIVTSCDSHSTDEPDDDLVSERPVLDCVPLLIDEDEFAIRFVNATSYDIEQVRVNLFPSSFGNSRYEFRLWPSTLSCYEVLPRSYEIRGTRHRYSWLTVDPVGISVRRHKLHPVVFETARYTFFLKVERYVWPIIRDRMLYLDKPDSSSTWVRVVNAGKADFRDIILDSTNFGNIQKGDTTAYLNAHPFRTSFSASLIAGSDTLWFVPSHDTPIWPNGYYTIRLDTVQTWRLKEKSEIVRDS